MAKNSNFFLNPSDLLDDRTPLDVLQVGKGELIINAAASYGEHGGYSDRTASQVRLSIRSQALITKPDILATAKLIPLFRHSRDGAGKPGRKELGAVPAGIRFARQVPIHVGRITPGRLPGKAGVPSISRAETMIPE